MISSNRYSRVSGLLFFSARSRSMQRAIQAVLMWCSREGSSPPRNSISAERTAQLLREKFSSTKAHSPSRSAGVFLRPSSSCGGVSSSSCATPRVIIWGNSQLQGRSSSGRYSIVFNGISPLHRHAGPRGIPPTGLSFRHPHHSKSLRCPLVLICGPCGPYFPLFRHCYHYVRTSSRAFVHGAIFMNLALICRKSRHFHQKFDIISGRSGAFPGQRRRQPC